MPTYTDQSGNSVEWDSLGDINAKANTARVTGSNATTTGQSLVNITGLTLSLPASSVYEFESRLSAACSDNNGNQYGVNFSASGASVEAQIVGAIADSIVGYRIDALNTAAPAMIQGTGTDGMVLIKGVITVGSNAGSLTVQHLKITSGTATVYKNSMLTARRIG
jgi:hypothetical protein